MKTCTGCKIEQDENNYCLNRNAKDGLNHRCNKCRKQYYQKNREKILKEKQQYFIMNKEEIRIRKNLWHKTFREKYPEKYKERVKIQYQRRKKQLKEYKLKTKYGLTFDDINKMLLEQNNLCKICLNILTKPNVDHCHITGKVRGLLCGNCNTAIGLMKEDLSILNRAHMYLFAFQAKGVKISSGISDSYVNIGD